MRDSEHTHSEYVSHRLNFSPTKTSYSFSKMPRFTDTPKKIPLGSHSTLQLDRERIKTSREGRDEYISFRKEKKNKEEDIFGVQREVERIVREMEKERLAPKMESPNYDYTYVPRYVLLREEEEHQKLKKDQKRSSNSPTKRQLRDRNSPQRHNRSPTKLTSKANTEGSDFREKLTCSGYYPTGLETHPLGKYPSSKVKYGCFYSEMSVLLPLGVLPSSLRRF
jgi:hypothetical protein